MRPEDILRQQARLARIANALQRRTLATDSSGIVIDYNADYHLNLVQMWDGSIRYAAALTNGVQAKGDEILFHRCGQLDSPNAIRRVRKAPMPKLPERKSYSFWILMQQFVLFVSVKNSNADIRLLCSITDFPAPYDDYHDTEPGLLRKNNSEFYYPMYRSIDLYDIKSKTAQTILGVKDVINASVVNTRSCCSYPYGNFYFTIETGVFPETQNEIVHLRPEGTFLNYPFPDPYTGVFERATPWSIAAASEKIIFIVFDYGQVVRFDIENNLMEDIAHANYPAYNNISSRYGSQLFGFELVEISYVFSDPSDKSIYCVAIIKDSGIPELKEEYSVQVRFVGEAPESLNGKSLKIVRGNFPPGVVCPSDDIKYGVGVTPLVFRIYRVIDDNTVYINEDFFEFNRNETIEATLDTRKRHTRTAIFKIKESGEMEFYYKFPGIDNRLGADGYRLFYNLPCRAGVIDPKTKDIYMLGSRSHVIENGLYLTFREGFDDGSIVKIRGSSKELVFLKLNFHESVGSKDREDIRKEWYATGGKIEPIF